MAKIGAILIGVIFIVVGVGVGYGFYNSQMNAQEQINKSVQTTGEIVQHDVTEEERRERDPNTDRIETETVYEFTVEYEYQVNGEEYVSDFIQPSDSTLTFDSRTTARDYKQKYPVGEEVTVNYVLEDPNKAYLEEGSTSVLIPLVFISIFPIVGLILVLSGLGIIGKDSKTEVDGEQLK